MHSSFELIFNESREVSSKSSTILTNTSSLFHSILLGLCLGLIALITSVGNVVVLMAFYCDNKLRTVNDYFILNMAVADFLVGFICIPFYIPFTLTQSWSFGRLCCKIWVTIDDVSTMASVINIVAISVNRYWSIAFPISYRKCVRQEFVYAVMASVWLISFVNFAPGIWLLSLFNRNEFARNETRSDCAGDYHSSFPYMLIAQFNYFIWPFVVLCVLNVLIMINIWKRGRKMTRLGSSSLIVNRSRDDNAGSSPFVASKETDDEQSLSIVSKAKFNSIECSPPTVAEDNVNVSQAHPLNRTKVNAFTTFQQRDADSPSALTGRSPNTKRSSRKSNACTIELDGRVAYSPTANICRTSVTLNKLLSSVNLSQATIRSQSESRFGNETETDPSKPVVNATHTPNHPCRSHRYRQSRSRIVRDRRAARSLFILVVVFLIFLFPYVICATASTAGCAVPAIVFEISFWLLWLNSTCNPFLYPFIQTKYRRAYLNLFRRCAH